jgi:hypothetical protein
MVDIAPGGTNMVFSINWILIVHWVRKLYVAIFPLTLFGVDVISSVNLSRFYLYYSLGRESVCHDRCFS